MSDPLDELFDETPVVDAVPVDAPEPQEATPAPEAEVPVVPEAGKGEPKAAPPAAPEEKPQAIPISALLDEREKRQAAERRLAELESQQRAQEQKPDYFGDPEGAIAVERQQFAKALWNHKLDISEIIARQQYGDELVAQAQDAFMQAARQNPALAMDLQRQLNPYGFAVSWHMQQQALAEIGSDPAAYKAKLRAELMAELQAQAPAAPVQAQRPATTPPRSMASAPAAGSPRAVPAASPDPLFD